MPEQHNAPMAGEPLNTPADGGTPNAPGAETQPTNGTPTLDVKAIHSKGFNDGYGKGVGKGEQQADQRWAQLLNEHGIGGTFDEVKQALESRNKPASQPQANVEETDQFKALAREYRKATTELDRLKQEHERALVRADQARLDKFARAAMAKGVAPEAIDYFVPRHEGLVRMSESGDLVVLSKMPDGSMVEAGESLDDYLEGIISKTPFLVTPHGKKGAGSQVAPVNYKRETRPARPGWDMRPAAERLKDRLG